MPAEKDDFEASSSTAAAKEFWRVRAGSHLISMRRAIFCAFNRPMVGGTTLHARKSSKGQTAVTEVAWNDGPGSGTGGGVSDITPVPNYQEGKVPRSINPGHFALRAIPDVAANADPNTGYRMMSGGQLGIVGGTSASALWASLITRINELLGARVGNFNALLYSKIGPA